MNNYTEHYDTSTGSLHIVNEYGCDWDNGVGISPAGNFCGECDMICSDTCPIAKEEYRDIMEREIK